jgi:hypothetical protein
MASITWRRLCEMSDADFWKARRSEPAYEFANNRTFKQPADPYRPNGTSTGTST